MSDVQAVHAHLAAELAKAGVTIDRFYVAPEAPGEPSRGRKPSPQFLFEARDELGLDLAQCHLVGDKLIDLECGWNAGLQRCILVRTGYGAAEERKLGANLGRTVVTADVAAAAQWILDQASLARFS